MCVPKISASLSQKIIVLHSIISSDLRPNCLAIFF
jgi:hypothetical protein